MASFPLELARSRGWPVVAEPFGDGDREGVVVPHGPLLLGCADWLAEHQPERVLLVGRPTLTRAVGALLRRDGVRVEAVTPMPQWADPGHVVAQVHPWSELLVEQAEAASEEMPLPEEQAQWARVWREAGQRVTEAVQPVISGSWPSGVAVATEVAAALDAGDLLVVGSSNPARDLDLAGGSAATVVANRGLAGIDGMVSTAVGVALSTREEQGHASAPPGVGERPRVLALVGDLTFLHDGNGLAIGPGEPRPDLTVVVVNDDGGGIFATLEYGEPERAETFERLFGTPVGTDLGALCAAHGVHHELADSRADLADLLAQRPAGLRVVEVAVPRDSHRRLRADLQAAAVSALT